jgi:translation initiation factor IF-1
MAKSDLIQSEGQVIDALPNAMFKVLLDAGKNHIILATVSGKIRINNVNISNGDKVTVEMSPYDLTRGRIVYRKR